MARAGLPVTRTVRVSGVPYVQVVDYIKQPGGKYRIDVIKSFGREDIESWLRAEQFAVEYNVLESQAMYFRSRPHKGDFMEFRHIALAIFGMVLGPSIVLEVLREVFGE